MPINNITHSQITPLLPHVHHFGPGTPLVLLFYKPCQQTLQVTYFGLHLEVSK